VGRKAFSRRYGTSTAHDEDEALKQRSDATHICNNRCYASYDLKSERDE
jgi:hypothetical protein